MMHHNRSKLRLHQVLVTATVTILGLLVGAVLSLSSPVVLPVSPSLIYPSFDAMQGLRSILLAAFSVGAVVSSALVRWRGSKLVSVAGGVLTSAGMLTTATLPHSRAAFFVYTILAGTDCGLVCVSMYETARISYSAYRPIVYGLLGCASSAGYLLAPPVSVYLSRDTNRQQMLLIMSGVVMNTIPFSLLLPRQPDRPVAYTNNIR